MQLHYITYDVTCDLLHGKQTPLSMVDNGHKLRLILDLSCVNKFLCVPKFCYEDIRTLKDLFQRGDFFFKFDIKSAFGH